MGGLYLRLCLGWNFTTNISCCKSGWIIIAWDPRSFLVDIICMNDQGIHCLITSTSSNTRFTCSFIYGYNDKIS